MRRQLTAGIAVALALAFSSLALAACGGSGSESGGDESEINLVAYSTPREAYEELTSRFSETPEGEGVSFAESYGSSGEQTRAVIAGLDADVVALSLAPDLDKLVDVGPGRGRLDEPAARRDGHELRRRPRHAARQSEGHQGLGRPPEAGRRGRHAQPVHLGRRALERHGRLRRLAEGGPDRRAGAGEPPAALPERRRPGQERTRLPQHLPQRQGRRPARVRERGDLLAPAGRGPPLRHPERDDPDREPGRRPRGERRARRRRRRS